MHCSGAVLFLFFAGTSPSWTTSLWVQSFLDTLLDPRNNDPTPWSWLKAICREWVLRACFYSSLPTYGCRELFVTSRLASGCHKMLPSPHSPPLLVYARYCGSDDTLTNFPPTEIPEAAQPEKLLQVTCL